jgi:hypothetical protein
MPHGEVHLQPAADLVRRTCLDHLFACDAGRSAPLQQSAMLKLASGGAACLPATHQWGLYAPLLAEGPGVCCIELFNRSRNAIKLSNVVTMRARTML